MKNNLPTISVIIPAYNAADEIEILIDSLRSQSYDHDKIEIYIVDNNSQDKTREIIEKYEGINLILQDKIQSSYASRNEAIDISKGDILAFTDSDCVLTEDWLKEAISCFDRTSADIIGGNIEFTFSDKMGIYEKYDSIYHMNQRATVARGRSVTANIFVKRHVFEKAGKFRNDLISGGDSEWCERALKAGFKMEFCENALLFHPARIGYHANVKKEKRIGKGEGQIRLKSPKYKSKFNEIAKLLLLLPFDTVRYLVPLITALLKRKIVFWDFIVLIGIAKWMFFQKRLSTIKYIKRHGL
ncbi:MAG: glycosyltransferase [Candidatus Zixiibacteriota bacterium]